MPLYVRNDLDRSGVQDNIRDTEESLVDSFGDVIHRVVMDEGGRRGLQWREE